jgi:hypothetical protein
MSNVREKNKFRGLILFLASNFMLACAAAPSSSPQVVSVQPQFSAFVSRFETVAAQQGRPLKVTNLIIQTGDLPVAANGDRERAVCETATGMTPTITVDNTAWAEIANGAENDLDREELLFHEMGHCLLGRVHNHDLQSDGTPVTMMNPYRIDHDIYSDNHAYYVNELFHTTSK